MNPKYVLNKFNCNHKENMIKKVQDMKYQRLPKENREEYKTYLKIIQEEKIR